MLRLPEGWYQNLATTFFGFPPENFYSTDYFSLIPWLFLYLSGYFLYRCVLKRREAEKLLSFLEKGRIPLLRWIGQHSLLLYLLHQPVIFVLLQLLQVLFYR